MMAARGRTRPPALRTFCAACGEPFEDTRAMLEVDEDLWVHVHACEDPDPEPTASAPLVFAAGLIGFFGGVLLLEALGWLWPAAVTLACVACVTLAWEMCRGGAS